MRGDRLIARLEHLKRKLDRSRGRLNIGPTSSPRRLRFLPDQPVSAGSRAPLRFTSPPAQLDRVRITNWNAEAARVRIAEAELELAPGESADLWMDAADPDPVAGPSDTAPAYSILADHERFAFA